MREEAIPGAELEAPDVFQSLLAPYWPRLPLAIGYAVGARWVALYLKQHEVLYTDGANLGTGDTKLFWMYKRHPKIAPFFSGAHLLSAETPASEWLVLDTHQQVLYLAGAEAARRHLAQQWLVDDGPPLEYTSDELTRRLSNLEETSSREDLQARVDEALREARANHRLLLAWLDQQQDAPTSQADPEEGSQSAAAS